MVFILPTHKGIIIRVVATVLHRAGVDHATHRDAFLSDEHEKIVNKVRANHAHATLRKPRNTPREILGYDQCGKDCGSALR